MPQPKKQSYSEWVKGVNPNFLNPDYDLERAYNELDIDKLEAWRKDPDNNHLPTMSTLPDENGVLTSYKKMSHPTIGKEEEAYNSPEMADFRSRYDIDKTGEYLKYIPKKSKSKTPEGDFWVDGQ